MSLAALKKTHKYSFLIALLIASCAHNGKLTKNVDGEIDPDRDEDAEVIEGTPDDLEVSSSRPRNAEEIEADKLSRSTFPLVYNEFVDVWIRYFTENHKGRGTFERYLARSTRYIPLIKKTLKEEGLPEDLIYLSMIESGFNPKAYSRAKAVGMWQFMKGTGQRYGLKVDYWIDERRDIVKSTRAAAQYLKELHMIFGSWYLAAASYNAGEGRVLNAVRREQTRDFWELARSKGTFRKETSNYVPKMIAAALISKNPEKYGFNNIVYEQPLEWESVEVPPGVDLRSVAEQSDTDVELIKLLNSELRIGITPPDRDEPYLIHVPLNKKALIEANLDKLKARKSSHFIVHHIERGENLGSISRRFKTQIQTIMELNDIRNPKSLRIGQEIRVPIPSYGSEERSVASNSRKKKRRETASTRREPQSFSEDSPESPSHHVVKRGETLSSISKKYHTSVSQLLKINNLNSPAELQAGKKIKVND